MSPLISLRKRGSMQPLLPLEAVSRMNFVLSTMILANTVIFSVFPKLSSVSGGGSTRMRYVVYIYVTCPTMRPRGHHLHPPTYEYVFRLRIIKRMRKQWKPGPFLHFSGLGTRLLCIMLFLDNYNYFGYLKGANEVNRQYFQ